MRSKQQVECFNSVKKRKKEKKRKTKEKRLFLFVFFFLYLPNFKQLSLTDLCKVEGNFKRGVQCVGLMT